MMFLAVILRVSFALPTRPVLVWPCRVLTVFIKTRFFALFFSLSSCVHIFMPSKDDKICHRLYVTHTNWIYYPEMLKIIVWHVSRVIWANNKYISPGGITAKVIFIFILFLFVVCILILFFLQQLRWVELESSNDVDGVDVWCGVWTFWEMKKKQRKRQWYHSKTVLRCIWNFKIENFGAILTFEHTSPSPSLPRQPDPTTKMKWKKEIAKSS